MSNKTHEERLKQKEINAYIRELRIKSKMSCRDFTKAIGVTEKTYYKQIAGDLGISKSVTHCAILMANCTEAREFMYAVYPRSTKRKHYSMKIRKDKRGSNPNKKPIKE